jgi:hypothetical protein
MSFYDFSADKEATSTPIPAGVYNLVITEAEDTHTKKMDKRVKMTFTVMDGEHKGRKIWEGYNLTGANEKAVQISRGQIKALLKAGGKEDFALQSAADFIGIEIAAVVKVKTDETYGDKNVISAFKPKKPIEAAEGTPF